jgi:hypothetical protein
MEQPQVLWLRWGRLPPAFRAQGETPAETSRRRGHEQRRPGCSSTVAGRAVRIVKTDSNRGRHMLNTQPRSSRFCAAPSTRSRAPTSMRSGGAPRAIRASWGSARIPASGSRAIRSTCSCFANRRRTASSASQPACTTYGRSKRGRRRLGRRARVLRDGRQARPGALHRCPTPRGWRVESGAGPRVDWCAQRPDARRNVPCRGLAPQSPFAGCRRCQLS